jgi:hypothetical protein
VQNEQSACLKTSAKINHADPLLRARFDELLSGFSAAPMDSLNSDECRLAGGGDSHKR